MVQQGDKVIVNGITATVTSIWGQGKHTAYSLDDGRVMLDLDDSCIVVEPLREPYLVREEDDEEEEEETSFNNRY